MNDGRSKKQWEITLDPYPLIHVHYTTASQEVMSNGFKGWRRSFARSPINSKRSPAPVKNKNNY